MKLNSSSSLLRSLKGRIWLTAGAMAVMNCVCGLLAYLAASLLISDPFYSIFVTYLLSGIGLIVFGKWLGGEILRPIDKLSMLAQTLERSPAASLPRTTGAAETDELLFTLQRNGRQIHNLIAMMDDVAAGRTDRAIAPLESNDRLSASFQKLVAKVTDSVDAQAELIALQTSVSRLAAEVSAVRSGNLSARLTAESGDLRTIADAVRGLCRRLSDSAARSASEADELRLVASRIRNALRLFIDDDRSKTTIQDRLVAAVSDVRSQIASVEARVSSVSDTAGRFSEGLSDVRHDQLKETIESARTLISDSDRRLQKLRTVAAGLPHANKAAEELSKRSKILSLNASLQAAAGFADEIGMLSARAETVARMLSETDEAAAREIGELDETLKRLSTALDVAAGPAVSVSEWTTGAAKCLAGVVELSDKIKAVRSATANSPEPDVPASIDDSVRNVLAETENEIARLLRISDELARDGSGSSVPGNVESRADRTGPMPERPLGDELRHEPLPS